MGQDAASVGQSYRDNFTTACLKNGLTLDAINTLLNNPATPGTVPVVIPPPSVYANPGTGVEAENAEIPLAKNSDGSLHGRVPGTSIVFNSPG